MLVVPLQPVPSQVVTVTLNNQSCKIAVYQKSTGLYLDLYVSDTLIIGGVICQNANLIVRDAYLGFSGDLAICDTQATKDASGNLVASAPDYTGLGSRLVLFY